MTLRIAIDGPSGSGKSSTSRGLASRGGWEYLDTGALYRMVTLLFQNDDRSSQLDSDKIMEFLDSHLFEVSTDPQDQFFKLDGQDISALIRSEKITSQVSAIAAMPEVRKFLYKLQRFFIDKASRGIVVEGRDIGSVVMKEADFKVFLQADLTARSMRRSAEMQGSDSGETARNLAARDVQDSNRQHSPLTQVDDAFMVDSTEMTLEETIDHLWQELRNRDLLGLPRLAIIGRPNVGKSSLINRITGRNDAITEDRPGITRDVVEHLAEWNSREFVLVDTGGWSNEEEGLDSEVAQRSLASIESTDLVLLVVDGQAGAQSDDEKLARLIHKSGKPAFLVVNKVDNENDESSAYAFWNLGMGEPHFISSLHGRGSGDLLDRLVESLPEVGQAKWRDNLDSIAIIGRPNVGKSSLLNALVGQARAIVDDQAGTTRDPIDEVVTMGQRQVRLVDTAGIRRKAHQDEGANYFSVLRTERALERSDLALLVLDSSATITEQDLRLITMIEDSGKALVIVMNKWDLVDEERRNELERESERAFDQVLWADRINISAKTGWHKDRLLPAIEGALASWRTRIPTGRLNSFIGSLVSENPPPVRGGKQPKIQYCVQASVSPPTFIIFATGFLETSYRRFIERRLREDFGFRGSPVRVSVRLKEEKRR